jgi:pimeloyl-ACP methyl ester carboxylesterase
MTRPSRPLRRRAYRRDVPGAEVHLLDAGHFALDEQPDQVAELTRQFLRALPG